MLSLKKNVSVRDFQMFHFKLKYWSHHCQLKQNEIKNSHKKNFGKKNYIAKYKPSYSFL